MKNDFVFVFVFVFVSRGLIEKEIFDYLISQTEPQKCPISEKEKGYFGTIILWEIITLLFIESFIPILHKISLI